LLQIGQDVEMANKATLLLLLVVSVTGTSVRTVFVIIRTK